MTHLCSIALRIANSGILNTLADTESRRAPSSGNWMLSPVAFKSIQSTWKVQVYLFASEWNRQLPIFVSWFPQPQAWRVDAFSYSWKNLDGFCFSPFNLIPFVLSNLLKEKADLVLVTHFGRANPGSRWPWLSFEASRLLQLHPTLLTSPMGEINPPVQNNLIRLIARRLLGVSSKNAAFWRVLSISSSRHLIKIQSLLTSPPGTLGDIVAFQGIKIPCLFDQQL